MPSFSKNSERLSNIILHFPEAILVEDENREVLLTNEQFCQMFGYEASPADLVGMDCSNAAEESKIYFKDPEAFVSRIEEILLAKEVVIGDELELADGRFLLRDYIPFIIEGDYLGHTWKYRDITESKKISKELEKLDKLNTKLFSILTHDLRGPLSSLLSILEMIEEKNFSLEELQDLIPKLSQDVSYTNRLVNNLLTWSSNKLSGYDTKKVPFNLTQTLDNVFNLLSSAASEKEIELVNLVPENSEIIADQDMIETILRNLIYNAIKFTNEGGTIEISSEPMDPMTVLQVKDDGIGMDDDLIKNVFDKGVGANWGTAGEKGVGLGLNICKEFAEAHGGEIWAKNNEGPGSSFCFSIPQ